MRIVRVKNRLAKGTKDILINLQINNRYLAEVQLAIITGNPSSSKAAATLDIIYTNFRELSLDPSTKCATFGQTRMVDQWSTGMHLKQKV